MESYSILKLFLFFDGYITTFSPDHIYHLWDGAMANHVVDNEGYATMFSDTMQAQ